MNSCVVDVIRDYMANKSSDPDNIIIESVWGSHKEPDDMGLLLQENCYVRPFNRAAICVKSYILFCANKLVCCVTVYLLE